MKQYRSYYNEDKREAISTEKLFLMGSKEYTYFEWNIQGAGGCNHYATPHFVVETILNEDADVVVLVEFYISPTFDYLISLMNKRYYIFISLFTEGHNQVLIALKKDAFKKEEIIEVNSINTLALTLPEYLSVKLRVGEKNFFVIGTRIKTKGDKDKQQFEFLKTEFEKMDAFVCIGDFNRVAGNVKFDEPVSVYSPRTKDCENWSFVHQSGDKVGIDLVVGENVIIKKSNGRNNQFAEYDWSFVNGKNEYSKTSEEYLEAFNGKPNHAILKGSFILNYN